MICERAGHVDHCRDAVAGDASKFGLNHDYQVHSSFSVQGRWAIMPSTAVAVVDNSILIPSIAFTAIGLSIVICVLVAASLVMTPGPHKHE